MYALWLGREFRTYLNVQYFSQPGYCGFGTRYTHIWAAAGTVTHGLHQGARFPSNTDGMLIIATLQKVVGFFFVSWLLILNILLICIHPKPYLQSSSQYFLSMKRLKTWNRIDIIKCITDSSEYIFYFVYSLKFSVLSPSATGFSRTSEVHSLQGYSWWMIAIDWMVNL